MKLFVLLLASLGAVSCREVYSNGYHAGPVKPTGVVASVREYPSIFHKCTATFVTKSALISPAGCLLCVDNCKLYVAVFNTSLESKVTVHAVKNTLIHPNYEENTDNDIGIIYLEHKVRDAPVHQLPSLGVSLVGLRGNVYAFLFDKDAKNFRLVESGAKTMTNELCSTYLFDYIPGKYLCVIGDHPITLGPYDHGSPMLAEFMGSSLIMGFFSKPGFVQDEEIVLYLNILPYINWIHENIGQSPGPTTTTRRPTSTTTTKRPTSTTTTRRPTPTTTTKKTTTTTYPITTEPPTTKKTTPSHPTITPFPFPPFPTLTGGYPSLDTHDSLSGDYEG